MTSFSQDVRFGLRMLFKSRGQTLAAVAALALGIGLTVAMFSIVYGAMLRGLPFEESERIVHLENNNPSREEPSLEVYLHDFLAWKERQRSFEALAGFYNGTINLSGDGDPERFNGAFMSAAAFEVLRVKPILGRGFLPGEDSPQAPLVVVLGHGVWHTRYQGDPKVLGRPVRVNGEPGTIVGVMPQGFAFPEIEEVWTPLRLDSVRLERGQGETLEVMGRLAQGVTLDEAGTEMEGIARSLAVEFPKTNEGRGVVVKPWMEEALGDDIPKLLWTMMAACFFVLLIACTNVASLMMARASQRTREIAIRSALGASRLRVIVQLLLESLLLSGLGAVLGVLLARWGIQAFNAAIAGSTPPFWMRIALDPVALGFALGVTVLAALLSGLVPALQASKADVNEVLKDEGRGSSSLRMGRFSRVVVVVEVAFSCLLLVGAGLMIKSVVNIKTLDLGFDPGNVFTARIALFESTYPEEKDRLVFFENLLERLEGQPGVSAAAASTSLPSNGGRGVRYTVEGRSYPTERDYPRALAAMVTPSFFNTFRVRLLSGRGFARLDQAASLPVVVVNRSFAERVWPGEDPIGKRIRLVSEEGEEGEKEEPWRTVVGVSHDALIAGFDDQGEEHGFYIPLAQSCPAFVSLAVKTATDNPLAMTDTVRRQVRAIDKDLPIYFVLSMDQVLARNAFFPNLFGSLFAIFGLAALLLAAVGIYGVIAFSVEQRTQEIGIRMALGANHGSVLGMILKQGALQLGVGLACGLVSAFFVSRLLATFLVGVKPNDPAIFALVTVLLSTIALLACWFPAQRAARTDPLVAIRYD